MIDYSFAYTWPTKLALFGFELGSFGFVFYFIVHSCLFVVHCKTNTYVHLVFLKLGLFCIKKGEFVEIIRHLSNKVGSS
jgi:hypothetical protein